MNKLFKRDFTMVVFGQIISLFSNAILRFACPFTCFARRTPCLFMGISLFEAVPKNIGYFMITAISFGAMCASTMFSVSMLTAVQRQTRANLLGKIMAVIIAVLNCSQPVGQAVYGVLFDIFADKLENAKWNAMRKKTQRVKIEATTGNIRVENTSAGLLDLSVTTGEVTVSGVTCPSNPRNPLTRLWQTRLIHVVLIKEYRNHGKGEQMRHYLWQKESNTLKVIPRYGIIRKADF